MQQIFEQIKSRSCLLTKVICFFIPRVVTNWRGGGGYKKFTNLKLFAGNKIFPVNHGRIYKVYICILESI